MTPLEPIEPARWIGAAEVAAACPYDVLTDVLAAAHRDAPPAIVERVVFGPGNGPERFLALPAWQPGSMIATKLVTSFPANPATNGLPTTQAVVVLFDGSNGRPLAFIDGTELTHRKTAADSALGARHLARSDSATLLMVGAGGLAPHLIAAHRAARPSIERVIAWNRTLARAEQLVASGAADVAISGDRALDDAVAAADIVCTATTSATPLVRGALLQPGTHIDCVGAYLPDHREVDDDVVRRSRIFVDSRDAAVKEDGDLAIPLATGVISPEHVLADLFQLCRGEHHGRTSEHEITLFENGGGGHLDLMVAEHIWRATQP